MPLLDRVIELQSFTPAGGGDPTAGVWATVDTVWAEKMERHALERFVAAVDLATVTAAFMIRYRADVDASWRIRDDSGTCGTWTARSRRSAGVGYS